MLAEVPEIERQIKETEHDIDRIKAIIRQHPEHGSLLYGLDMFEKRKQRLDLELLSLKSNKPDTHEPG